MKIHLDLDSYFVSAERTRYPFLKGKNVVIAKSSDNKIFSNDKKEGMVFHVNGIKKPAVFIPHVLIQQFCGFIGPDFPTDEFLLKAEFFSHRREASHFPDDH